MHCLAKVFLAAIFTCAALPASSGRLAPAIENSWSISVTNIRLRSVAANLVKGVPPPERAAVQPSPPLRSTAPSKFSPRPPPKPSPKPFPKPSTKPQAKPSPAKTPKRPPPFKQPSPLPPPPQRQPTLHPITSPPPIASGPNPEPPPTRAASPPARASTSGGSPGFRWPPLPPFKYYPRVVSSVVIPVNICGRRNNANMDLVETEWNGKLAEYFKSNSFGSWTVPSDPTMNRIIKDDVEVGCNGTSRMGISWTVNSPPTQAVLEGWGDAADAEVRRTYGINLSRFAFRVYLLPPSLYSGSSGTIDCPYNPFFPLRTWSGGQNAADNALGVLLHELGHNMGLSHSKGYDSSNRLLEYGDGSCPMGSAYNMPHFNMPQSVLLGWTRPQAVLDKEQLPVGVWKKFALRGIADAYLSGLQFAPWTWDQAGWRQNDRLYVSFRHYSPATSDALLQPQYRDKVQVHNWLPGTDYDGCAAPILLANLDDEGQAVWPKPGSSAPADRASPGVTVRVLEIDGAVGVAFVNVCRGC